MQIQGNSILRLNLHYFLRISDRLIYTFLGYVIPKFKTPLIAIVLTGLFAALLALILDLSELVNLTSIGTLLAYALVSSCNLVLRYEMLVYVFVSVLHCF